MTTLIGELSMKMLCTYCCFQPTTILKYDQTKIQYNIKLDDKIGCKVLKITVITNAIQQLDSFKNKE